MVPLFLNNACPEGSLDILYHKPACRYKMGDEIRFSFNGAPEGQQQKHSTPSSEDSTIQPPRSTKPSAIAEFSL